MKPKLTAEAHKVLAYVDCLLIVHYKDYIMIFGALWFFLKGNSKSLLHLVKSDQDQAFLG
jgi:hypothetical protein